MGAGLARQGVGFTAVGMWAANIILVLTGLALLPAWNAIGAEPFAAFFLRAIPGLASPAPQRRSRAKARTAPAKRMAKLVQKRSAHLLKLPFHH